VIEVAEKYGKTPAQIAVAWLFTVPGVVCPVVGVSKAAQLTDLVAATELELQPEDVAYLEALYQPVENLLSSGMS
jgi:aryl-alcohol dehydrogenase-like predicted oxidoreductase